MAHTIHDTLQGQREAILARLLAFVAIPSVSADPAYASGINQGAAWLVERLRAAGLQKVTRFETGRHPILYAEWCQAPGKPTVLVYAHYDVQPPDPLEAWLSPPFDPEVRDGRLYGRGVSDDKGPLLTTVEVAAAYLATQGALPVNLKFLFEGEEEIGSPSIEDWMSEHAALLACDFVLSADGAMWRPGEGSLIMASRGLASLEFSVMGAKKDLHSGRHGGSVANPNQALAQLLASLRSPQGRVLVEGFYDQVEELSEAEKDELRKIPFIETEYLAELGAPQGFGEPGYSLLECQWTRPTLDVVGMWGGYQGPGSKTVIPAEAHAKISCRLVPNQDPTDIQGKIERHLKSNCPPGVHLKFHPGENGALPYQIRTDHPGMQVARQVLENLYQKPPLDVRIGATLPIADAFKRYLGADTIFFSFSTADEDFHAPNEFFRLSRLEDGLIAWAEYLRLLGEIEIEP